MFDINKLRNIKSPGLVMFGNHPGIIQSTMDFDYLAGKIEHSIVAIVGVPQKSFRYFWGEKEVIIPGFKSVDDMPNSLKQRVNLFAILQSARRVLESAKVAISQLPNIVGGTVFAEGVPEQHALALRAVCKKNKVFIFGPSSVGLTVSGMFKLGAIGGTTAEGIQATGLIDVGTIAVVSSSGGMVNELINMVAKNGYRVSFATAIGGERYPMTTPLDALRQAIDDKQTKALLYFGELGGQDEYEIADYLISHKTDKPIICYIAGQVAEYFEVPPQFGHAKALAGNKLETSSAKKVALREVGVTVADSFLDFETELSKLSKSGNKFELSKSARGVSVMAKRKPALFVDRISSDQGEDVKLLNKNLLDMVEANTLSSLTLGLLLGQEPKSKELINFFDFCLKLLVDHGPQVSGAVNTMITARAGRDLASSLASGILTIGSRFGGAINQSAQNWLNAVSDKEAPADFVEGFARSGQYVSGIGHKKYRSDIPDPRVTALIGKYNADGPYLKFARQVEQITLSKKAQLILNVDGAIAAIALDILQTKEKLTVGEIQTLIDCEFFNAIFILARSIGFTAHFMEQKRLDEGLFRLPDELISSL